MNVSFEYVLLSGVYLDLDVRQGRKMVFQFVFEELPPERWKLMRIIERGIE